MKAEVFLNKAANKEKIDVGKPKKRKLIINQKKQKNDTE
jgi:hypothetical protein